MFMFDLTRLWKDAENRTLLSNFLIKNYSHRPKIPTVEEKLMVLGCNHLNLTCDSLKKLEERGIVTRLTFYHWQKVFLRVDEFLN
uniref:Uncharacterized protein n=1 Tax=Lactuca sativa TaxID=4236 RepID=A0A9R1UJ83_LACSA|nr:hypothetical protein LSAT_V11C900462950 [Lactuca sativa]